MNDLNFDKIATIYDETRSVPQELIELFELKINSILKNTYKQPPYQILSVGIGSGRVEKKLSTNNMHLFGIDMSESMLRELKKKPNTANIAIIQADANKMPFRGKFHLAVAIHVIHLIENKIMFLNELRRTSKIIVLGNIFTDAYQSKIYSLFKEILSDLITESADNIESLDIRAFMHKNGYEFQEYVKSYQTTQNHLAIYQSIKKRYFSSLWKIPMSIYDEALEKLDKKIIQDSINLNDIYATTSTMNLQIFKRNITGVLDDNAYPY